MLNSMTGTPSIFLHSDPTVHWPSTHATLTEQWPQMLPSHPRTLITLTFFWDLPPCDQMRRSSWDPTQHNNHSTQHTSGWMHYAHTADDFFLGVTVQQAHTPPPHTSEHKVGYLAVKQEQLSYILVMPLLNYRKVPAELSETAWIKGILSQRHCNINTLCLVT